MHHHSPTGLAGEFRSGKDEGLRMPPPPPRDDYGDGELRRQRGVISDLMGLAAKIREAAKEVAMHVEFVAAGIDRERRGPLSVEVRRDDGQILEAIEKLVGGALLPDQTRDYLLERLVGMVTELRAQVPLWQTKDRGIDADRTRRLQRDRGREDALRLAVALGVEPKPIVEGEASPPPPPPTGPANTKRVSLGKTTKRKHARRAGGRS